jgi:hypothetical protein
VKRHGNIDISARNSTYSGPFRASIPAVYLSPRFQGNGDSCIRSRPNMQRTVHPITSKSSNHKVNHPFKLCSQLHMGRYITVIIITCCRQAQGSKPRPSVKQSGTYGTGSLSLTELEPFIKIKAKWHAGAINVI